MSQRVVVLTEEELAHISEALASLRDFKCRTCLSAQAKIRAAFEHLEGVTDEQVERAQDAYNAHDAILPMREALEAALFPGEDERR